MDKQVIISVKTIVFTLLLLFGGYIVYRLGPIIGILLISLLVVVSVEPAIKYFMKITLMNKPVSRGPSVILTYFLFILVIAAILTVGLPPFVIQAQTLLKNLSNIAHEFRLTDKVEITLPDLLPQASAVSGGVLSVTVVIFSNLTTIFSVLIISLYMSMDWPNIKKRFAGLFPDEYVETVSDTISDIEINVGHWVKGQLILMFIIGLFSFIGLTILEVPYALALGLIAGLLEIVPMIGPILSAVLAGVIGFVDAPFKGFGVIILFTVIQQLENNILVPQIMKKVSGFSPLVILLALLVGSEFFGILGAVAAVPITMVSTIILKRVLGYRV